MGTELHDVCHRPPVHMSTLPEIFKVAMYPNSASPIEIGTQEALAFKGMPIAPMHANLQKSNGIIPEISTRGLALSPFSLDLSHKSTRSTMVATH